MADDGLECSICVDKFKDPKIIPCFHTFCSSCIQNYITRTKKDGNFLCPICRKSSEIPATGVEGFQSNFYITQQPTVVAHKPKGFNDANALTGSKCVVHPGEDIVMFCKLCKIPCCRDCKIETHDGHPSTKLSNMLSRLIPTAEKLVAELTETVKKIEQYDNEIKAKIEELETDNANIKTEIMNWKLKTDEMVQNSAKSNLKILNDETKLIVSRIKGAQEKLMGTGATFTQFVKNIIEKSTLNDPLQLFVAIRDARSTIDETKFDINVNRLYTGMEIQMSGSQNLHEYVFGKVAVQKPAPKLRSEFKEVCNVQLQNKDRRLFVKAMLPVSDDQAWLALRSLKTSDCKTVLWKINMAGELLIVHALNKTVNSLGLFKDGAIVLSFPFDNKISIFENEQNFIPLAYVKKPLGMAVFDSMLYVCSVESNGFEEIKQCEINRVLVLSRNGNIIRSIEFADGRTTFAYPGRISINYNGDICVSDFSACKVFVLSNDGTPRNQYSGIKGQERMLCGGVHCDSYGQVVVESNHGIDFLGKNCTPRRRYTCIPSDRIAALAVGPRGKLWLVTVDQRFKVIQYVED